ncbi:MAG: TolC family protein, partial [Gemmatimonadota bacterium]|nr:TolC family protein [Gemmatimonadota bacterium]
MMGSRWMRAAMPALLMTFAGAPLKGQEVVTLEEAVARALVRSPQMAQADQSVGNAQAGQRQAWGGFLPSLSASSSASKRSTSRFDPTTDRIVDGSSNSYSAGLSASYTLFAGGRRFAEMDRAGADYRGAEARRENQRFLVRYQTQVAFFLAVRQEDLLAVAERRVEQALESLEMVRTQTQVGTATRSDSLRARLEWVNSQQALNQAENSLRGARFALGRQIGEGRPVIPRRPEALDPRPLALTDEELMILAVEESPAVRAAAEASLAAAASVSSAKAAYLPSFSVSSGYDWANQQFGIDGGSTSWSLSLRASYPI